MTNSNSWANDNLFVSLPSEDILSALGETMVLFNLVDGVLGTFIATLISRGDLTDLEIGEVVSTELSFKAKVALASCLANVSKSLVPAGAVEIWMNQLVKLEERRNQLIHSQWIMDSDPVAAIRTKRSAKKGSGFKFHEERVELKDLHALIRDIRECWASGTVLTVTMLGSAGRSTKTTHFFDKQKGDD